ncbi:AMP-binding protein [Dehalobacter sp. DCM]|uniref:class I adenylate-forming enzyme family protein n=1 Tax=Dehalobacter sp. DCM TaxID=2907827 RepID=UPI003081AC47|nr:AMP-binding protein [Dehalobacter sp. DCM]
MNLISIMQENAGLFSDSVAVIDGATEKFITYKELWRQVNAVASGLKSIGIAAGDRIGLYLPNGAEFIISYFAILMIGAIAVPFDILFRNFEIKYILENSSAKAVIGLERELSRLLSMRNELPNLLSVVGAGDQMNIQVDRRLSDWIQAECLNYTEPVQILDSQPAAIHYTSGTTGRMKGVVLSHYNIAVNTKINGHYLLGLNDQDRVLGLSPFNHVYYFQVVLGPLSVGAAAVTLPRSSPRLALEAIEKYRITHLSTVPTMFRYLLQQFKEKKYDLSSWRVAGSAAANINPDLVMQIRNTFGVDFFDTYGSTEASSTITYTRLRHYKSGSVGMPAHGYMVKVVDDQELEVPVGEVGELVVRGPGIFRNYWELPEKTEIAFTVGGWYKSGDIARLDHEGYVYIIGRKNDMIISGGYKIYPLEIEEMLLSHPEIADAIVVKRKDPNLGEVPVGYVILKSGAELTPDQIITFCQERLAKYKCPRIIEIRSDFPRSPSGKTLRRCLESENNKTQE